jgi:hypothetical protein
MIIISAKRKEESEMNIKRVVIDLAKHVFQVHGVDCHGKVALRKQLKRESIAELFHHLTALFGWHGSLRGIAPLGAGTIEAGPYRAPMMRVDSHSRTLAKLCQVNRLTDSLQTNEIRLLDPRLTASYT